MAKQFRTLREAISHAAVYGRPKGTRCALGGASHYQSGDDGPDEGEALVVRTIVHDVVKGNAHDKERVYVWAVTGGNDGHCTNHMQEKLRERLRRAGVLAKPVKRIRVKRVVRDTSEGEMRTLVEDSGDCA